MNDDATREMTMYTREIFIRITLGEWKRRERKYDALLQRMERRDQYTRQEQRIQDILNIDRLTEEFDKNMAFNRQEVKWNPDTERLIQPVVTVAVAQLVMPGSGEAGPNVVALTQNTAAEVTSGAAANIFQSYNTETLFDSPLVGRIRYKGTPTKWFLVRFMGSCATVAGGPIDITTAIRKNGSAISTANFAPTETVVSTTQFKTIRGECMVQLATNDYVSAFVTNSTDSNDLTFAATILSVEAINI